jgi:GNAT superfamily N-acetyltransferase
VPDYRLDVSDSDLTGVAAVYQQAGFRDGLIDDVRFVRSIGGEVFVAIQDRTIIGVSSCLPFVDTGWIGGVAVMPDARRHGVGRDLTEHAMDTLRAGGASTILLHATAQGRPLYEAMGFIADADLVEFTVSGQLFDATRPVALRPGAEADYDAVVDLDREATGEDRSVLLRALWPGESLVVRTDRLHGFNLRHGSSSTGAVVADEPQPAQSLFDAVLSSAPGAVRLACSDREPSVAAILRRAGYAATARTTRMHLGKAVRWRPERVFSTFNLYWG